MGKVEGEKQLGAAYYYSYVRYIMNFYTVFSEKEEAEAAFRFPEHEKELLRATDRFLEECCEFGELYDLKKKQLSVLDFLMKTSEWLQIHGYALQRAGRRLGEVEAPRTLAPESAADDLMLYIMEGENPLEVNQRIQDVLRELPVSFTKNKFYSVIEDSLKPYLKRSGSDFSDMLQRIRDAAALEFVRTGESSITLPKGWLPDGFLSELAGFVPQAERCDYKNLNLEAYRQMNGRLEQLEESVAGMLEQMIQLSGLLNDLMVMVLASDYAEELPIREELRRTLNTVARPEEGNGFKEEELFAPLEGRQEYFWSRYLKYLGREDGSPAASDQAEERTENACFITEQLLSGSFDVRLSREEAGGLVTEAQMEEELTKLFTELEQRLKRASRFTGRAVMASVLASLPVWFNSLEEVESYIKDSFSLCLDKAEKEACLAGLEPMVVEHALV